MAAVETELSTQAERVLGILLHVALARTTITYTRLANLVDVALSQKFVRAALGGTLTEAADYAYEKWGIALTAVVVGGRDGLPSGRTDPADPTGFWRWCDQHEIEWTDKWQTATKEQMRAYKRAEQIAAGEWI